MPASVWQTRRLIARNRENFPVASLLLPRDIRRPVLALYDFARHADDIADDPGLTAARKVELLDKLDQALTSHDHAALPDWAQGFLGTVEEGRCNIHHGKALLSAFRQDAIQRRYQSWEELMDYCNRSAAPIGRAILEMAEEHDADLPGSDALCNALQVINHLQDAAQDYRQLDRIYLPMTWLREADVSLEQLSYHGLSGALRKVYDRMLERTELLLRRASSLPSTIRHRGLRMEICVILELAWTLTGRLREDDALEQPVRLGLFSSIPPVVRGCWYGFDHR